MKEFVIYRKDILKRCAIFGGIGLIILIFLNIRWHYKYLGYQFNGRVDSISYGDKGTPIVIIKGESYLLNASDGNLDDKHIIEKGDSLIKMKNTSSVKLIKLNGQVIIFK